MGGGVCGFDKPVYEMDVMTAVGPGPSPVLEPALLDAFPEGYRYLAYLQTKIGLTVTKDLPGTRRRRRGWAAGAVGALAGGGRSHLPRVHGQPGGDSLASMPVRDRPDFAARIAGRPVNIGFRENSMAEHLKKGATVEARADRDRQVRDTVEAILADVERRGDAAVR